MPRFVVDKGSIQLTISGFKGSRVAEKAAAAAATAFAGRVLLKAIREAASIPPIGGFDLPDGGKVQGTEAEHKAALAAMDHPYARRHRTIQYRPSGGPAGYPPEMLVHRVTGELLSAIQGKFDPKGLEFAVNVDKERVPHAQYVIAGTRVMHGRDFLRTTMADPRVRRDMLRSIVDTFGRIFRSKANIRFV